MSSTGPSRRSHRAALIPTFILASLLAAPAVLAAQARVGIPRLDGPGELEVRRELMRAVDAQGHTIVGARAIELAAQKLGVALGTASGARAVANDLRLTALVTGAIEREGERRRARVMVRSSRGALLADETFTAPTAPALAKAVGRGMGERLTQALARPTRPTRVAPRASTADGGPKRAAYRDPFDAPAAPRARRGGRRGRGESGGQGRQGGRRGPAQAGRRGGGATRPAAARAGRVRRVALLLASLSLSDGSPGSPS